MTEIEQPVVDFFLALQRHVNATDAEAIAGAFASELLMATPAGAQAQTNDAAFRTGIQQWLDLLKQAGMRDAKALQIDPTPLGADYALVQVRWSIWFMPEGRGDFVNEFLVDYLVAIRVSGIEIITAIVHDDEASRRALMGLAG
jgi:hypothetical protein